MNMTDKLTIKQITDALASFGCQVEAAEHSISGRRVKIAGLATDVARAVTSLIEAATLDANIECGKAIERQKYWRNRSVEASTELSEAWGDYAAMKIERDELRKQLAAAQNDVKQLRQSRDRMKVRLGASMNQSNQLRAFIDSLPDRKRDAQDAISTVMAAMHNEGDNDGWIECRYLPINQWCDVKRADGTMDRVCRPEVRGVQQAAEITHYRPIKKEAKPNRDDGWIEWHGDSTPPIKNGIAHQVKFLCGEVSDIDYAANTWAWGRKSGVGSHIIVAYRLAK